MVGVCRYPWIPKCVCVPPQISSLCSEVELRVSEFTAGDWEPVGLESQVEIVETPAAIMEKC